MCLRVSGGITTTTTTNDDHNNDMLLCLRVSGGITNTTTTTNDDNNNDMLLSLRVRGGSGFVVLVGSSISLPVRCASGSVVIVRLVRNGLLLRCATCFAVAVTSSDDGMRQLRCSNHGSIGSWSSKDDSSSFVNALTKARLLL